jgi:sugar-specific transcriptional regulator TrmB
MEKNILKDVGLSETESKVYLALLTLGSAQAGEITKKSELNRTNVYDALDRLSSKGLITYVHSANTKIFEPVNPNRLKELIKEKEKKIDKLIPQLQEKYNKSKQKEDATIYKGKKGVKYVFEEMLKQKEEILTYGAQGKFSNVFPVYRNIWESRRQYYKIKKRIIYNESVKKQKTTENQKFAELKFLPKEYDFPSTILIQGATTITVVWSEQPFAFVVNSENVTKTNKNFFELLWKIARK